MKEQTKKNLKTAAMVTGLALGATYLVMRHIAKKQYPDSVYANQPEEQNPVEGRKVIFVEDANDPVNADGKQGHLEAVANTIYTHCFNPPLAVLYKVFDDMWVALIQIWHRRHKPAIYSLLKVNFAGIDVQNLSIEHLF